MYRFYHVSCELKWIQTFPVRIGNTMYRDSAMRCDNAAANARENDAESVRRAKHIDIKNHYLKSIICSGYSTITHVIFDHTESDGFKNRWDKLSLVHVVK